MAAESTEPKSRVIIRVAVAAVATLVVMRFALISYFRNLVADEVQAKAIGSKPEQLLALRQQEQHDLYFGKLPVNKAMMMLATDPKVRREAEIAPEQSSDLAPLVGWIQRPQPPPKLPLVTLHDGGSASTPDSTLDASAPGMTPDATAPKTRL